MPFVGGTGAGDAFDTGFIAGLLAGQDTLGCLGWGSAMGASCVRAIGATESLFNRDELLEFLDQHQLNIEPV
ncbi:putative sugar kinase YdjH [compost metagenome]